MLFNSSICICCCFIASINNGTNFLFMGTSQLLSVPYAMFAAKSGNATNANNDFEWFNSDIKHIEAVIQSTPGTYKENPSMGVGINNYLNSSGAEQEVSRKVIIELNADLYQCNNPLVS